MLRTCICRSGGSGGGGGLGTRGLVRPVKTVVRVLGIETSCDDTCAAILEASIDQHSSTGGAVGPVAQAPRARVLSQEVVSQNTLHEPAGGIVPGLAGLAHTRVLPGLLRRVLASARVGPCDLTAVAVTRGPGLAFGLRTGLLAARTLCATLDIPLYGVHHLDAHALTPRLRQNEGSPDPEIGFPFLSFLVSGGNTMIVLTAAPGKHHVLGRSIDDAAGEVLDKVARYIGLKWLPQSGGAGAALELAASKHSCDPSSKGNRFEFTIPFTKPRRPNLNFSFSFSGMKAQALRHATAVTSCSDGESEVQEKIPQETQFALAAAFQSAVVSHICDTLERCLHHMEHNNQSEDGDKDNVWRLAKSCSTLVLSGGVARNALLRSSVQKVCEKFNKRLVVPDFALCTDNAVMIAWAAIERMCAGGGPDDLEEIDVRPKWPF